MSQNGPDTLNPNMCISYRLRRAARVSARHYDAALKSVGLRNTQFTLLSFLFKEGGTNIGALARDMGVDATTLNRNLNVLVRRGLVENHTAEDGRERLVALTPEGLQKYEEAANVWREAQQLLLASIEPKNWTKMVQGLSMIEETATQN